MIIKKLNEFLNEGVSSNPIDINDNLIVPLGYEQTANVDIPDYYIKFMAYAIGDGVFGLYKDGKEEEILFVPEDEKNTPSNLKQKKWIVSEIKKHFIKWKEYVRCNFNVKDLP